MFNFTTTQENYTSMVDQFQHPDYYLLDELLSEEHKMIRDATREWVKRSVSPIIEDFAQRAAFPQHLVKEMGEVGLFGPYVPKSMEVPV